MEFFGLRLDYKGFMDKSKTMLDDIRSSKTIIKLDFALQKVVHLGIFFFFFNVILLLCFNV